MSKNSSRGIGAALLFFLVGFVAGALLGVLLHIVTTGKFETVYLLDLPSLLLGVLVAIVAFLYALVGYWGVVRGLLWQVAGLVGLGFYYVWK